MKTNKKQVRDEMLDRRAQLGPEEVAILSGRIISRVFDLDLIQKSQKVGIFISVNNEVDTKDLIDRLVSFGHAVYVPKYSSKDEKYHFCKFVSWQDLEKGPYGIFQPNDDSFADAYEIDRFFLPGVAFDIKGVRVGYGKGVYDRLLEDVRGLKIGICYDFQLIDRIEADNHDVKVDWIVTEKRAIESFNYS